MNTHTVRLGLHSYSFENHFRYQTGFDAFAFIDEAERLSLSGVRLPAARGGSPADLHEARWAPTFAITDNGNQVVPT